MKKIIVLFLVLVQTVVFAQQKKAKDNFNVQIRLEKGDLNKDGLADKTVITMDTIDASVPLRLQIFFQQPNKKFKLVFSSTSVIEPQYINGIHTKNSIPYFFIEGGYLLMNSEKNDVRFEHKFIYKNGSFQLIKISSVVYDGQNSTTETVFDLVSGVKTATTTPLGSTKESNKYTNKIMIRPLPTLQNLKSFGNKLYW
ncbi:hypothetical protein [Pedobacter alluvionis]|uniref:VCBS repeat-containing protein n=1 Tax=Pedobacter alluvionis TaxID=475253 RepID=A0A497YL76_9SPHI|nr:hypothetical protein [Pedobacter alluvionis]RLJ80830.1 hypothetical protein BCL90_1631 [Pedobacter alluvionis]TFB32068.1 hypothetical protein E3V97_16040 [Pedobacter alluvionis]